MKKYNFETSSTFDNLVKEYGLEGISDLDVGEECDRHNINYRHLETWEYENGYLEIYVED